MAIKIDIPGVGEVSVDGAAEENTLLSLLAAVKSLEKSNKNTQQKTTSNGDNSSKVREAQDSNIKKLHETNSELDDVIDSIENFDSATSKATTSAGQFSKGLDHLGTNVERSGKEILNFGVSLAATAVNISASLVKNFDNLNPIRTGADLVNVGIDAMAGAAKVAVGAIGGVSSGLLGMIPVIGDGASKAATALSEAAKAAVDLAANLSKTANDVMAKQFQNTVDSMKKLSASGASFAGGMSEMREIANKSGIGLSQFTDIISKTKTEILGMGLNSAEASEKLSKGLNQLATSTGRSGKSLRDEMLALGYNYEQQGEVMAGYLAQQKSFGRDLNSILPEELAQGTKEYAENLKVLSDMTGQDAKKLMEKARAESMRGALAGKLSDDQNKAFQDAHASLSALGPEFQNALTQQLAGGTVTDPIIAGNKQAMDLITKTASQVRSGNVDMVVNTQKNIAEAADAQRKFGEKATDTATLLGRNVSPVVKGFSDTANKLAAYRIGADAAQQSKESAKAQSEATDELTDGYQGAVSATNQFQVQMEKLGTEYMPQYGQMIAKTTEDTTRMVTAGVKYAENLLTGKGWTAEQAAEYMKTGKEPGQKEAEAEKPAGAEEPGKWEKFKKWAVTPLWGKGSEADQEEQRQKEAAKAKITQAPSGAVGAPSGAPADMQKYLQATALIESGGNTNAKASTSSAGGMYQFLDSTWKQMSKEMGKDYTLQDKFDPKKSAEVMQYFTQKQQAQLEKGTGKKATNTDLYMSHFLGAGGATKFINAMGKDPNQSAAALDPAAAKANKSIYFDQQGKSRSLKEVYDLMGQKMAKAESAVEAGKWGGKDLPSSVAMLASNQVKTPDRSKTPDQPKTPEKPEIQVAQVTPSQEPKRYRNVVGQEETSPAPVVKAEVKTDKKPMTVDEMWAKADNSSIQKQKDVVEQLRKEITNDKGINVGTDAQNDAYAKAKNQLTDLKVAEVERMKKSQEGQDKPVVNAEVKKETREIQTADISTTTVGMNPQLENTRNYQADLPPKSPSAEEQMRALNESMNKPWAPSDPNQDLENLRKAEEQAGKGKTGEKKESSPQDDMVAVLQEIKSAIIAGNKSAKQIAAQTA